MFYRINQGDFFFLFGEKYEFSIKKYLLIPFYNKIDLDKNLKTIENVKQFNKYKKLISLSLLSELLGTVCLAVFSFLISNFNFQENFLFGTAFVLLHLMIIIPLLYLAVYDLVTYSIPVAVTKKIIFIAILANLVVILLKLYPVYFSGTSYFHDFDLGNIGNLLSGIGVAVLMWLIVKITKEKAMGEGDVDIMFVAGIMLGWPKILIAFLSTLIVGSIISIFIAIILRKFKGLVIPFVPFILLGYVIALVWGESLYRLIILF